MDKDIKVLLLSLSIFILPFFFIIFLDWWIVKSLNFEKGAFLGIVSILAILAIIIIEIKGIYGRK